MACLAHISACATPGSLMIFQAIAVTHGVDFSVLHPNLTKTMSPASDSSTRVIRAVCVIF